MVVLAVVVSFWMGATIAQAAPQTSVGAYRVEVTTDPQVIPVGQATLRLRVTDAAGKPVKNARVSTLTKMPGMFMGEKETPAREQTATPGIYTAPASFPMGGSYAVDLKIAAPQGNASGSLRLQTGQNTAAASGSSRLKLLPYLGVALLLGFVFYRMKRTGQRVNLRPLLHWQTLAGIGVLVLMGWGGVYAVNHLRRPGSMTPLEAQGMEMSMPAPSGALPVELATVKLGNVRATVRYSGQAVGFNEQEVFPRVTGTLISMPFYAGDRVKRGQVLARLDRSQVEPQIAGQRALQSGAQQGESVARGEYQAALSNVAQQEAHWRVRIAALAQARRQELQMRAAIASRVAQVAQARAEERRARAQSTNRRGGSLEAGSGARRASAALREAATQSRGARAAREAAQSDLSVAQEEKSQAESDLAGARALVPDAQAEVVAAQAAVEAETLEINRLRALVGEGLVSQRDVQRQTAQVEAARSRVKQAQARVIGAQAQVGAAGSRLRRADANIRGARAKASQADAAIEGALARQESAQAEITAAGARVLQSRAELESAGADIGGASAKVRQMEADVQAAREAAGAAAARVQEARAELEEGLGAVRTARAQAATSRSRIAQAQSGIAQARAGLESAQTTAGYTEIRSLLDGVVTQRLLAPGTLVQPGQAILRVAQIDPIRLQVNVAEADLARIRVGTPVTVRDQSGKTAPIEARVASVAPAVDPQSRTGLVEAIIPNPSRRVVPGEYVVMELQTGQSAALPQVPSVAIQQGAESSGEGISSQPNHTVWVAQRDGAALTVRRVAVQIGAGDGRMTAIQSGLRPGQQVVTAGYQFLKDGDTVTSEQPILASSEPPLTDEKTQTARVSVTERGFEPATLMLRPNVPARVTFERKTDATCATEVLMPDYKIHRKLPLNQPVVVEFTPRRGEFSFACGMNMLKGQLVAR